MYKMQLEYVEGTKMRIEKIDHHYGGYIFNLYLCKVPNNFSGIYYHTRSQHSYWTGGHEDEHTETAYQTNVNILLKDEFIQEKDITSAFTQFYRIGLTRRSRSADNEINNTIFIKNGYICIRFYSQHVPDYDNNLFDTKNNLNLGLYIIS